MASGPEHLAAGGRSQACHPGLDDARYGWPPDLRELRKRGSHLYLYFAADGELQKEDVIAGLESGADDYLTKPFHANELRARLRSAAHSGLQEQLTRRATSWEFHATHDSLTASAPRFILEILPS